MNRKPRVPESACFRKVAMASVVANLPATRLTVMFYLFKSSFRLKQEIFPVRNLDLFTCILSQVLLYLRHTFFFKSTSYLLCFREASEINSWCARIAVHCKFELSNFKKSHCAHIAKHMTFFRGGSRSNKYAKLKKKK